MKKIIAFLLVMLLSLFCIIGINSNASKSQDPSEIPALVPPTPIT